MRGAGNTEQLLLPPQGLSEPQPSRAAKMGARTLQPARWAGPRGEASFVLVVLQPGPPRIPTSSLLPAPCSC